ncbi:hypothetical protein BDY21DRAFT_172558 [Lineolata rhizophorae]|uniref:Fungal N-terminal domain-containing protein n=1 Tax=Lineolata rhizophorae TaxID=578093 RepID=A0A6A6NL55_9PEZI|nr:hypothetical protein BDY21DRAFT_172558 [Lineolata rhizophorae]
MDGAASVLAVVSIAIQLSNEVLKLKTFLKSVQNAQEERAAVIQDLNTLAIILQDIRSSTELHGSCEAIHSALVSCRERLNVLSNFTAKFRAGIGSPSRLDRQRAAFNFVVKAKGVEEFKKGLGEAKMTLLLAYQHVSNRWQLSRFDSQQDMLLKLSASLAQISTQSDADKSPSGQFLTEARYSPDHHFTGLLEFPASSPGKHRTAIVEDAKAALAISSTDPAPVHDQFPRTASPRGPAKSKELRKSITYSSWVSILGHVYIMSTVHHQDNPGENCNGSETKTKTVLVPSWWLQKLGLRKLIRTSVGWSDHSGWNISLKPVCIRPYDTLIFRLCKSDDVHSVRALLHHREASIHDVDPEGRTLLELVCILWHLP